MCVCSCTNKEDLNFLPRVSLFFAVFLNPSRGYLLSRLQYSIGRVGINWNNTERDTHRLLFIIFIQTALNWELKKEKLITFSYLCIIHWQPIGRYARLFLEIALKCIRNILHVCMCVWVILLKGMKKKEIRKKYSWKNFQSRLNLELFFCYVTASKINGNFM